MSDTVWIAAIDYGYEGMGDPLKAFVSKELADVFVAGAEAGGSYTVKLFELPVLSLADLAPAQPVEEK